VLGALFLEAEWETAQAVDLERNGESTEDVHPQTSKTHSGFRLSQKTH
jgi:hypothetical protein